MPKEFATFFLQRQFLPRDSLSLVVYSLERKYPKVFSREALQIVGIDIPAREILNNRGNRVESRNSRWILDPGSYQIKFGFQVSESLQTEMGLDLEPMIFWRSSHHRCGAGGGVFINQSTTPELSGPLFNGEIIGNYHVWNLHGIQIEREANVAQLCFTTYGSWSTQVSELLRAKSIRVFTGKGIIGKEKTTLPSTRKISSSGGCWKLNQRVPYLVEFEGIVHLENDEVLVPNCHYVDWLKSPLTFLQLQHSCLGDPGYSGRLGMLIVPLRDINLPCQQGIARVAKYQVLPFGKLAGYNGQWKPKPEELSGHEIEFRYSHEWGLVDFDARNLTLEDVVANLK